LRRGGVKVTDFIVRGRILSFRNAIVLAVSIVLMRLALFAVIGDKETFLTVDDVLYAAASGLAAVGLLYAWWNSAPPSRNAWMVLAIAQIANTFGDSIWAVIEVGLRQNPFPSLADAGYLAFYPLFALGILLLPAVPLSSRERQKILLDAGIVVIASVLICWVFIIAPIVAPKEAVNLDFVVSAAYPIMDLVLFIALVELIFRKLSFSKTKPIFLLALGLAIVVVADAIFCMQIGKKTYVSGDITDFFWLISYMLFWLAGVQQANLKLPSQPAPLNAIYIKGASWTQYLPYIGIGVTPFLLVWGYESTRFIDYFILAASIGSMVGLMFVRQKATLDESNGLLATTLSEIEERKKAESKLQEQINFLRALMDTIPNPIFYKDEKGIYLGCNDAFEKATGMSKVEIIGKTAYDIAPKDLADKYNEMDKALLRKPGAQIYETSFQYYDGSRRDIISNKATYFRVDGTVAGIVGVFVDITEHKRAEEALKRERDNAERYLNTAEVIIVALDIHARITLLNRKGYQVLGFEEGELIGKDWIKVCLRPEDYESVYDVNKKIIAGEIEAFEYYEGCILTKKGEERIIGWHTTVIKGETGRIIGTLSSGEDITERRVAEEALAQSEEKYRTLFETMMNGVVYQNADGKITSANPAAERILGMSLDQMQGRTSMDVGWRTIHEDGSDFPAETHPSLVALRTMTPIRNVIMGLFNQKEQNYRWISINAMPQFKSGDDRPYQVYTTLEDITERKLAERALQESENMYRAIFENTGTATVIVEDNTIISLANSVFEDFVGYTKEEIEGKKSWTEFVVKEDLERMLHQHKLRRIDPNAALNSYEYRAIDKNGRVRDILLNVDIIPGTKKSVASLLDITERKQLEESLRKSSEQYRILAESSQDMIYIVGLDDKIRYVNGFAARGLGKQPEEIIGRLRSALFSPEVADHQKLRLDKVFETGLPNHAENLMNIGGKDIWQDTYLIPLKAEDNETHAVLGISRDITERKRTEDMLKASLAEKELLLKEVHHRVKNNLQVISALLYLQSLNFTDDNIIKAFRDGQDRIKSIALIHESLYKSKSLGKVDLSGYIKQLISQLSQSYGDLSRKINFKVNADGVFLNINTAIPCGMIINELISNSLEHAFPDGRSGEICIDLKSEDDGFKLVVSDDGIGFNEEQNIKQLTTLGVQLIDTLAKQIDGRMSLDTNGGTRYEIHFKDRK
jgi:PAS domain S-box-containing protein